MRNNLGKPQLSLLPRAGLDAASRGFENGVQKYARNDWRNGFKYSTLIDSCLRHVTDIADGFALDSESGLHNASHALANLMMLMHQVAEGTGVNDLYDKEIARNHP